MKSRRIDEQMTLFEYLGKIYPDSSKTTLRSLLKEGRVQVDDRVEKKGTVTLLPGTRVEILPRTKEDRSGLNVLYEDPHLIVIDKPEGMLSVATDFETENTAHALLKKRCRPKRVFPVHRLDRETSGVLLFALSESSRDSLKKRFENREVKRKYAAIVEGIVEQQQGKWESYLFEDSSYTMRVAKDPKKGKYAATLYTNRGSRQDYTFLEIELETGKKNQIRIHAQHNGHPVAGDPKYGAATNPLNRLCLHAFSLIFEHPVSKKTMKFYSPVPERFSKLVQPNCEYA